MKDAARVKRGKPQSTSRGWELRLKRAAKRSVRQAARSQCDLDIHTAKRDIV